MYLYIRSLPIRIGVDAIYGIICEIQKVGSSKLVYLGIS